MADNTYVVTGYRELMAARPRSPDQFATSAAARVRAQPASDGRDPRRAAEDLEAYGHDRSIIVSDPPEHDRARRQVMRHFGPPHSPEVIPGMEPDICGCATNCSTRSRPVAKNRLDIVDDYAYPVPVAVICKILGVPVKDEPMFHAWIFDFTGRRGSGPGGSLRGGQGPRARRAATAVPSCCSTWPTLIEQYRREPGEGLLSNLVNDDGPDGPMAPKEAVANAQLLLVAGHDSTVNTITHCVLTLLRNPESIDLLRRRPELIPRAIEEVQRLQSAVQFFPSRSATDDIEIGGTVIPKGAAVHLMYGAANRDPKRFTNPNQFNPERQDNEHFGWGSGIHTCMGGPLARLEVNLALETFLRRVQNPRLVVDPPPYRRSQIFRGPQQPSTSTRTCRTTNSPRRKATDYGSSDANASSRTGRIPSQRRATRNSTR